MPIQRLPSRTAAMMAMMRTAHLHVDDPPALFRDTLAMGLSGNDDVAALLTSYRALEARFTAENGAEQAARSMAALRMLSVWRARRAEARLVACADAGIDQCVILGAGLDSTAYRRHEDLPGMRFYEVDHPASQAWKRARLTAMGVVPPQSLAFVAVDFERDDLHIALARAGADLARPVVVNWLGVSYYLSQSAIATTLRAFADLAPGSEMVMDYILPPRDLTPDAAARLAALHRLTRESDEPLISAFEPEDFAALVAGMGLDLVCDEGPEGRDGLLEGRCDGLAILRGQRRSTHVATLAVPRGPANVSVS
jgi:methyltransferase (TIGR00027 family)